MKSEADQLPFMPALFWRGFRPLKVVATLAQVYGQWTSGGGAAQAVRSDQLRQCISALHSFLLPCFGKMDVNRLFNEIQGHSQSLFDSPFLAFPMLSIVMQASAVATVTFSE